MAKTFDAQAAVASAASAAAKINEQIVTQTLDKVNKTSGKKPSSGNSMSDTYDFSKKVLSSVYEGKGTIADAEG